MQSHSHNREHFRIGVLGGMGPEAGVLLQKLIIRATPAATDQEHLEVLSYTNPHIPDRTVSLREDGGASYLGGVVASLRLLEGVGVDVMVIACNTAHARFKEIQASVSTPLVNIVELAREEMMAKDGVVGILATDGTLSTGQFQIEGVFVNTLTPPPDVQREVMSIIHDIKKGMPPDGITARLAEVVTAMQGAGCSRILLGCTELSIYHDEMAARFGSIFIEPMRLAAKRLVEMAGAARDSAPGGY